MLKFRRELFSTVRFTALQDDEDITSSENEMSQILRALKNHQ